MCLTTHETVLALADGNVTRTAELYTSAGYKAKLQVGPPGILQDQAIIHGFATFHWDRMDLSPVTWQIDG